MTATLTTRAVREPTLIHWPPVLWHCCPFTSPWYTRVHFYLRALRFDAQSFVYRDEKVVAKGWRSRGVYYVTRVRRLPHRPDGVR